MIQKLKRAIKTLGKWFLWYQAISFGIALIAVTYVAIWHPDALLKFTGLS